MSRPTRLVLVARWPIGGIRTYLRYVYRHLDFDRYRVLLLAPRLEETDLLLEDLEPLGVEYRPLGAPENLRHFLLSTSATLARQPADIIHAHGLSAWLAAALPSGLRRVRRLVTGHDVFADAHFQGPAGRLRRAGVGFALASANAVHASGEGVARNFASFFPKLAERGRLVTIRSGVEVERFAARGRRDFRAELGLSDSDFLVGFFGRFLSLKGFRYLVDAMAVLERRRDLPRRPVVLTFGQGGFIREDRAYVKSLGLEARFHFLDFAPDIALALRGLDVLTIPSTSEALCLMAMEALVAGVPVIGTDIPGLTEVLAGTPATIVAPRDAEALAGALGSRMSTPGGNEAEAFRATARERFDVRKTTERLDRLYQQVLRGEPLGDAGTSDGRQ